MHTGQTCEHRSLAQRHHDRAAALEIVAALRAARRNSPACRHCGDPDATPSLTISDPDAAHLIAALADELSAALEALLGGVDQHGNCAVRGFINSRILQFLAIDDPDDEPPP